MEGVRVRVRGRGTENVYNKGRGRRAEGRGERRMKDTQEQ